MGTTSVCEETTSSVSLHYYVGAEVIIFYEDGMYLYLVPVTPTPGTQMQLKSRVMASVCHLWKEHVVASTE